jgi:hypothetical protein
MIAGARVVVAALPADRPAQAGAASNKHHVRAVVHRELSRRISVLLVGQYECCRGRS